MTGSHVDGSDGSFDCDGRVRDLEEMECAATSVVSINIAAEHKINKSLVEARGRRKL